MLTRGLSVRTTLGQLQIRQPRLDMQIQQPGPFQTVRISSRPHSFQINVSPLPKVTINTRAIQDELGFRRPDSFMRYYSNRGRQAANQAVGKYVSEGNSYLRNPTGTTVNQARAAGAYSASTTTRAKPENRPRINFSAPSEVTVDYQKAQVDVSHRDGFALNFDQQPTQINLNPSGRVDIGIIPIDVPQINIDVFA